MQIQSDDIIKLNKLYQLLDEEGLTVKKIPVDDESKDIIDFIIQVSTNVDIKIQFTVSLTEVIMAIGLIYGYGKKLLVKKPSGEEVIIDAEIIENPKLLENKKKIESLDIPKDSVIEIIE